MKKWFILGVLASSPCGATVNQIDYLYGWGNPRSSVDLGYGSTQEGSRGTEWSLDFLHRAHPHVYFGVGGGIFHSKDNTSTALLPLTSTTVSSKMSTVLGLVRLDMSVNPKALTYLIAGIGWVEHSLSITSGPQTLVDGSKDAFGYAVGVGLDIALNDRLIMGVEARYQGSTRKSFEMTPEGVAATGRASVSAPLSVFFVGVKAGVRY